MRWQWQRRQYLTSFYRPPRYFVTLSIVDKFKNTTMRIICSALTDSRYHICFLLILYLYVNFLHLDMAVMLLEFMLEFLANVNSVHVHYMLSPISLSVCNACVPYSAGWNFRQFLWHLVSWPSVDIHGKFYRDCPRGTPPSGGLNATGVAKYSNFGPIKGYISETGQIGGKLVLITNRKSYMSFQLVPKSVTLNDIERCNSPYFALFHRIR